MLVKRMSIKLIVEKSGEEAEIEFQLDGVSDALKDLFIKTAEVIRPSVQVKQASPKRKPR